VSFIIANAKQYLGQTHHDGHCVRFLQEIGKLPPTKEWRRGQKVRGNALAVGTCVATFSASGHYESVTSGASHAAILQGEEDVGLAVIDCWVGQPVQRRIIRFKNGMLPAADDGDAYYVIESARLD
jgi:hypothetical protein